MNCKSFYTMALLAVFAVLAAAGYFIDTQWYLGMLPAGVWFLANIGISKEYKTETA